MPLGMQCIHTNIVWEDMDYPFSYEFGYSIKMILPVISLISDQQPRTRDPLIMDNYTRKNSWCSQYDVGRR